MCCIVLPVIDVAGVGELLHHDTVVLGQPGLRSHDALLHHVLEVREAVHDVLHVGDGSAAGAGGPVPANR